MAMPSVLRIGYQDYTVECHRKLDAEMIEDQVAGRSNGNIGRIQVRSLLPDRNKAETLLHEVLHQVLFCAGQENDQTVEEPIVRAMAMGLLQVFRDNPEFIAYLQES